jgi:DNA-directed RNA polymerase subunit RPC12/RpoP
MLVKCFCTNCAGHLEFEEQNAGERIRCPHCGFQTTLFLPETRPPDPEIVNMVRKRARHWRWVGLGAAALVVVVLGWVLWKWALPLVQGWLPENTSIWLALLLLLGICVVTPPAILWVFFCLSFPILVYDQLLKANRALARIQRYTRLDEDKESEEEQVVEEETADEEA